MTPRAHPRNITTVAQHIIEQQRAHPTATGQFSWLLSGITLATKIIESYVRRAGIANVFGGTGDENVQGEQVQKLDVIANETIKRCLGYRGNIGILVSEEEDEPRVIQNLKGDGRYVVLFDPLDGSSNIDVNVSIGTIFSVLAKRDDVWPGEGPEKHVLQPGLKQLAAGYVVYGSSTVLAYTTGDGVHMFTLNPDIGAFVLHQERVTMPDKGKTYSVNEAYRASFPDGVQRYLDWAKGENYSLRYIGSLVADFHRTLLRGGVFLYPPTKKSPQGKLRLLYEANPMAFLAEQAGGAATDGRSRVLEKVPREMHERTPLVIGSQQEVARVQEFLSAGS
ncbi:MAG TPA: class 1 fructose-bisphosphatase [Phycisphaerae bacterium]|nr:class 1 fructose-bisphosphatase [Phycisphaerales bacterium]HRX83508.1 class 1 fructose-bisphosphatase [Phycisphaerae bacterium]